MNKRYYEHTLPIIRGSLSNTYDEDSISFLIENMKDEYKAYEGDVTFSGTLLYLYYEARLPITGCHGGTYIYSLHLKDIQKREPAESPY